MKRLLVLLAALAAVLAFAPAALATPGDPYAPEYWFDQWQVPRLWASGARGQGVTIAEIDTGVDAAQPVFAGRVLPGIDLGRPGGDGRTDRDRNPYGHGTSMASIMVGRPGMFGIRGLAPAARLLPVAVPLAGTTDAAPDDRLADAIRWAADHGAKVISMSLGGARTPRQSTLACPADEQEAIFSALRAGAVLFAAAGNRGQQDNAAEEPSVCLGVVSVGAVDRAGTVAAFSSRQPYLSLSAPGVNVASIGPGGAPFSGDGTSQATALASAAAALVWSKHPQLSGAQVVARLIATADRHGTGRHSPAYGYGTIDAFRAVTAAVPAHAPNPVYAGVRPFLRAVPAPAVAPPAPAPAHRAAHPPGRYTVGELPPVLAGRVLAGVAVAGAGAALLLGLLAGGLIARVRRRAAVAADPAPDAQLPQA
jgi:subtilisin family serine protease